MDNHEEPIFMGPTADERITKLTEVALNAMRESEYYRLDDKLAVLVMNDVTRSDWDKSEIGQGFWNFNNPHDLINTLMNHIMAIGENYGVGIGVVEASIEVVPDPLDEAIRRALKTVASEVCNCPKCIARRRSASEDVPHVSEAIEQAMKRLLEQIEQQERGHNAEGQ
jgi:hypothetical protein